MPLGGHIVGKRTLVNNGPPSTRFDIVILGDGYQTGQLDRFDEAASLLARELLAMPAFSSVRHLVNVHTVRTVSTDSGISNFPTDNVPRETFYGVSGFFETDEIQKPGATFMGTSEPERVVAAAELVAPSEQLQLYIVLANLTDFAFSAHPRSRMVFASGMHKKAGKETRAQKQWRESIFVNYAAHECAHAITGNAEEYQDCGPPPIGRRYPNQMTEVERVAGQFKWKHLAQPGELNSDGTFKAVNLFTDADVSFDATFSPFSASRPQLKTMLGLFWQCQDTDNTPAPVNCPAYGDPRGKHFYRPMATCKMRFPFSPFCRVCSAEIVEEILDRLY